LQKNEKKTSNHIVTEDEWKTIMGFYILENSLRTVAAFVEVSTHMSAWGWTVQDNGEKGKNKDCNDTNNNNENGMSASFQQKIKTKSFTDGEIHDYYTAEPLKNKKKDLLDQTANIIRETSDDYQKAFSKLCTLLKNSIS
jgi:hypothetical protein